MSRIRTLIDEATIASKVKELGETITRDYRDSTELVVVPILKGSFLFASDLIRQIDLDLSVEFLGLRSYGAGTESSGVVQITYDLTTSISGKDVLVVEDIVDTGLTMHLPPGPTSPRASPRSVEALRAACTSPRARRCR
jgi:hypoxanthine phosphoribosyltransferase